MSEFEDTCRLCLRQQAQEKMVNAAKFDDIITMVCQTRLVKHPLIPRLICKNCASILLTAAMMRVNCVESNKFFLSYLSSKDETPYTELEAAEYELQLETEEAEGTTDSAVYIEEQPSVNNNVENEIAPNHNNVENKHESLVPSVQSLTKVAIVKQDSLSTSIVGAKKVEETKGYDCQNCRLCLKRFPNTLPIENTVANMKDIIVKIMDMKSYDRAQTMIPNKLCDDCLGNVLTASIIADRCKKAYKYFYSKTSAVITSSSCMVCLKDYTSVNDVCNMSNSTYSYMHYFASRNADHEYKELEGDKRICLRCMHDLEVANSVRYKNWKAEEVLSLQFSPTKLNKRKSSHASSTTAARQRGRDTDDDTENEAIDERWKPINPQLTQRADCPHCLKQYDTERALKLHIEEAHIPSLPDNTVNKCDEIKYNCNMCGLTLNNERTLKAHYLGVHLKKVESICDICGHIFHSQGKLENHRVIHFDDRNIKCAQCPATFKRLQNLRIHQRIHSGEKKFKCPYCSKAYAHSSDCKRHIASHNVT